MSDPTVHQTTHTAGPWVQFIDRGDRVINVMPAMRPGDIADIHLFGDQRDGEVEANARLIAAAPDLLAALKAVVRIADRKTVEFDAARAAIAKAEGGVP